MELDSSNKLTYLRIVVLISMLKCFRDQYLSIGKLYLSIDLTDELLHTGSDMLLEYGFWILEYQITKSTIADHF